MFIGFGVGFGVTRCDVPSYWLYLYDPTLPYTAFMDAHSLSVSVDTRLPTHAYTHTYMYGPYVRGPLPLRQSGGIAASVSKAGMIWTVGRRTFHDPNPKLLTLSPKVLYSRLRAVFDHLRGSSTMKPDWFLSGLKTFETGHELS